MANLAKIKRQMAVKSFNAAWAVKKDDNKEELVDASGEPIMSDWLACGNMGRHENEKDQLYPVGMRVISHAQVAAPLDGKEAAIKSSTKLYLDLCIDDDGKEYLQIKMLAESTQVFGY